MSRPGAEARLRRVLALVPWIAEHPDTSIDDLAAQFDVSRKELEADLALLPLCGLPPYSPDRLIDVEIVDDHVSIRFAEYFDRPIRLTPAEGVSVLAAGRALLDVAGSDSDGALAAALTKLESAIGAAGGIDVAVGSPEYLDALRAAVDTRERIEIEYFSYGRNELTTRVIDPWAVFHALGQWYVDAFCHRATDERLFRLDRIRAVRPTGEHFDAPDADTSDAVFRPHGDDPVVTLDLAPGARWVVETYPVEDIEERPDGRVRVRVRVSGEAWLDRVLLRLGPHAIVVDDPARTERRRTVAAQVLARYT